MGSSVLGSPATRLVALGGGVSGGEVGDRRPLASCRISALLALAFPGEGEGQAQDWFPGSPTHRADGEGVPPGGALPESMESS